jgi:hypothetical protein
MKRFIPFAILLFALGCAPTTAPKPDPKPDAHADHGHDHPTEGPHHGQLIELGKEEFHLELVHDDATHTISVYVLDSAAKKSVPVDAKEITLNLVAGEDKPAQYTLPAKPQADDGEGKASLFQLADEKLCTGLDNEKATGRINITINEKPYTGKIAAHKHDHDHKH